MNVNGVKGALTRKWGPLPAWGWFLIAFLVVYFYRKYSSVTATGTGTGSVGPAPGPPQAQTVLSPGESVYDPNTGALSTAPGGSGSGSDAGATDLATAADNLANAIASGMPPTQVQVTMPGPTTTGTSGTKHKATPKHKAKSKSKPKHAIKKLTKALPRKPSSKKRSTANTRHTTGGRTGGRHAAKSNPEAAHKPTNVRHGSHPTEHGHPGQKSTGGHPAPSHVRQRPRTPAAIPVVQQRQPAAHPTQKPRPQTGHPAPRPSAPAPRTQRSPKPPPKHRGK